MRLLAQLLAECVVKYAELKPVYKVAAWAAPAAVIVVIILFVALRSPPAELDEQGRLVRRGLVAEVDGPGIYDVTYLRPYTSPPELTWPNRPLGYRMLEERADGFRFEVTLRGPHDLAPRWEARGPAAGE